jgi:hypothetical protein
MTTEREEKVRKTAPNFELLSLLDRSTIFKVVPLFE